MDSGPFGHKMGKVERATLSSPAPLGWERKFGPDGSRLVKGRQQSGAGDHTSISGLCAGA